MVKNSKIKNIKFWNIKILLNNLSLLVGKSTGNAKGLEQKELSKTIEETIIACVKSLKKYEEGIGWRECRKESEKGDCASIVEYKSSTKSVDEGGDYVIIACNKTLRSITPNHDTVASSSLSMDKVYKWFDNKHTDCNLQLFLMDEDAPIKEDAKLLAQYIEILAAKPETRSISLVGISECGAMSFYVPSFFKEEDSFKKTNIVTVGTPFTGTITHSPARIYQLIDSRIISKFGDNNFAKILSFRIKSIYRNMRIDSHRFYDVAVINGIPPKKIKFYDSSFIREIFLQENLNAIRKVRSYKNFVLQINKQQIIELLKSRNLLSLKYYLMDRILFADEKSGTGKMSGGMVPVDSQQAVKEFLGKQGIGEILEATNNILEEAAFEKIIDYVSEVIGKDVTLGGFQKKI